jgi:hypothetical protein
MTLKVTRRVAILLAIVWSTYSAFLIGDPCAKFQRLLAWGFWTIVPPLWFMVEYTLFHGEYPDADDKSIKHFEYNQELVSRLWVAIAAALLVLYFKSF